VERSALVGAVSQFGPEIRSEALAAALPPSYPSHLDGQKTKADAAPMHKNLCQGVAPAFVELEAKS
jgi:hypothetical protein